MSVLSKKQVETAASLDELADKYEQRAKDLREAAERLRADAALGSDEEHYGFHRPKRGERWERGALTRAVLLETRDAWLDAFALADRLRISRPEAAAVLSRLKAAGKLSAQKEPGSAMRFKNERKLME